MVSIHYFKDFFFLYYYTLNKHIFNLIISQEKGTSILICFKKEIIQLPLSNKGKKTYKIGGGGEM